MIRTANRIACLGMVGSVALLMAMPTYAAIRADQPMQEWSEGEKTTATARLVQGDPPSADMAIGEEPYCADHAEIHQTLQHDFSETRIEADASEGTELWGSEKMGTWTLVEPLADGTSCIVASGTGFDAQRDAQAYYTSAGLK